MAEVLLSEAELSNQDARFPLHLVLCPTCAMAQITEDVPLDVLYNDAYPYYTSVSSTLVEHFRAGAAAIQQRKTLGPDSLVVEAASNDGCQLAAFQEAGVQVLGIDPASGPVQAANDAGIPSRCRFFDAALAKELAAEGLVADVITGNNVLNLIQDPTDFLRAVETLLADDGLLVLETPYLVDTIRKTAFDNVFHQNTTYWNATAIARVFGRAGFQVIDVERISTFGGSLRVYLSRTGSPTPAASALLAEEAELGVDDPASYAPFLERVARVRSDLVARVTELKAAGKRIVAYGAAGGMATTLLAYLGLPEGTFDYAVDLSHHKHGRYTSGDRLLIRPVETLIEDQPDYALLLAWNFEQPIVEAQAAWRAMGGKFLVPIPELREV